MNLAEVATRYGALGVVCLWLGATNSRLSNVESKLDDCQEKVISEIRNNVSTLHKIPFKALAVLPNPLKIVEDEQNTREI